MLGHVLPCLAIDRIPCGGLVYAEFSRYLRGAFPAPSYFHHHFIGELCLSLAFAYDRRSMQKLIGFVLFAGSPSNIVKAIVEWISISMASLMRGRWPWANERLQNQGMYRPLSGLSIAIKNERWVTFGKSGAPDFPWKHHCASPFGFHKAIHRSNSSVIRDFVEAFETDSCAPFFEHDSSPLLMAQFYLLGGWHG